MSLWREQKGPGNVRAVYRYLEYLSGSDKTRRGSGSTDHDGSAVCVSVLKLVVGIWTQLI